jgi:DNA-binding transcriptional LysR family regulator
MNENRLDTLMAFAKAAQHGSLQAAGQALGVSAATISRRITRLEAALQTRLLTRTTRRVTLTAAGRDYLARCQRVFDALDEADLSIGDEADADAPLVGRLRITTPGAFGRRCLAPLLAAFSAAHPALALDVSMTDVQVDLVDHDIDVAIRMAALADSSLVSRKLADNRRLLVAAPGYLAERGMPTRLDALADHDGLYFDGYGPGFGWVSIDDTGRHVVAPRERLRTTDVELILQFALAGRGIAILPGFMADDAVATGRLVRLLADRALPESAVHAVWVSRRHLPARTRRFVDFLAARLPDAMRAASARHDRP